MLLEWVTVLNRRWFLYWMSFYFLPTYKNQPRSFSSASFDTLDFNILLSWLTEIDNRNCYYNSLEVWSCIVYKKGKLEPWHKIHFEDLKCRFFHQNVIAIYASFIHNDQYFHWYNRLYVHWWHCNIYTCK